MTERVRVTADEMVVYADQGSILCVSGATRLLAVARGGVHILLGGTLTVADVIRHVAVRADSCAARGRVVARSRRPFRDTGR